MSKQKKDQLKGKSKAKPVSKIVTPVAAVVETPAVKGKGKDAVTNAPAAKPKRKAKK